MTDTDCNDTMYDTWIHELHIQSRGNVSSENKVTVQKLFPAICKILFLACCVKEGSNLLWTTYAQSGYYFLTEEINKVEIRVILSLASLQSDLIDTRRVAPCWTAVLKHSCISFSSFTQPQWCIWMSFPFHNYWSKKNFEVIHFLSEPW